MKLATPLLSIAAAAILSSCGGAGSCTNCSTTPITPSGTPSFSITAPTQYPAGVAVTAYLTMTNTSSVNATGLTYSVPAANAAGNNTGATITINPNGAGQNCTSIAANASCTFTATIPANSHPGSFTVTATSGGNTGNSAKLQTASLNSANSSTAKSLQASISVTANLGLVNLPTTNNQFYILPSDQVVPESSTTATTVYVSVLVQSGASAFDTLKLVDDSGTEINATLVGTLSTATNSVNTYKVVYPAGSSGTKHIQAYSYTGATPVCTTLNRGTNSNRACSNDADVILTSNTAGILSIQPNFFNLSSSYTSQVITLTNTGGGAISGLTLPTVAAPFSIIANNCTTDTLAAGASCSLTLVYTPGATSGQATPVIIYNNGTSVVNTAVTIPYTAADNGGGSGGGGTTPVTPTAILTASPTSPSFSQSSPEQRITIENTGTAEATDLALPTIVAPFVLVSTDCGSTLASKASCTYVVKIDYSQTVTAGNGTLAFGYNNGQSTQTTNVAADWSASSTPPPSPLRVLTTTPADKAMVQAASTSSIVILFDQAMDVTTINSSSIKLIQKDGTTNLVSTCSGTDDIYSCNISSPLISNVKYDLIVTTSVRAISGSILSNNYVSSFSTNALIAGDGQVNTYYYSGNTLYVSASGGSFVPVTYTNGSPSGNVSLLQGNGKGKMYFVTSTNEIWSNDNGGAFSQETVNGVNGVVTTLSGDGTYGDMYFSTSTNQVYGSHLGAAFTSTTVDGTLSGNIIQFVGDGVGYACFLTSTSQIWCGFYNTYNQFILSNGVLSGNITNIVGVLNANSPINIQYFTSNGQLWIQNVPGRPGFSPATYSGTPNGNISSMGSDGNGNMYLSTSSGEIWQNAGVVAYSKVTTNGMVTGTVNLMVGNNGYMYFSTSTGQLWGNYNGGVFDLRNVNYTGLISQFSGSGGYIYFVTSTNEVWYNLNGNSFTKLQ